MTQRRPRYTKADENQDAIKADLEASCFPHVWCDVHDLPVAKSGVDVYVIGYSLRHKMVITCPVEIKRPGESLNANEQEFFHAVRTLGLGVDIPLIAESADDILRWFGRIE